MHPLIVLAQSREFSKIQPAILLAHVRHALLIHPTWRFPEDRIGDGRLVLVYGYSGVPVLGTRSPSYEGTLLRMLCAEYPNFTLVISAEEASEQEKVEYGTPKEDL